MDRKSKIIFLLGLQRRPVTGPLTLSELTLSEVGPEPPGLSEGQSSPGTYVLGTQLQVSTGLHLESSLWAFPDVTFRVVTVHKSL